MPVKNLLIALAVFILTTSLAFSADRDQAVDNISAGSDMSTMTELLAILEEETEIATKFKMNADYVPGIVTVLHGDDLEALGIQTVWEALGLVPGIETLINNYGRHLAVVRGIGMDLLPGHLKVMLNSVQTNMTWDGGSDLMMMMPIGQVERIDIIRGPGAALYGEFSYAGVVNIVTRKEGKKVYVGAAQFNTMLAGGLYSFSDEEGEFKASLNIAGGDTDGANVDSGPDAYTLPGSAGRSYSPGATNEIEQIRSAAINVAYKNFGLNVYGANWNHGQYFGIKALQPPGGGPSGEGNLWYIEARQAVDVSSALKADFSFHVLEGDHKIQYHMVAPPGAQMLGPAGPDGPPGPLFTDGLWLGNFVKERRTEGSVDLAYIGWNDHHLLGILSVAQVEVVDSRAESNFNHITGEVYPSIQSLPEEQYSWVRAGTKRQTLSVAIQDQFQFSESFSVTVAVRYDDFDDVGSSFTPRLAGVWRVGEPHIFKIQYAQAFRPPTFLELYMRPGAYPGIVGNPDLEPETMDTYEAGYIFRKTGFVGRATIYYTKLKDMIQTVPAQVNLTPVNIGEITLQGGELEWEQQIGANWKTIANLSYSKAYDESADHEIGGSTDWLGNLTVRGRIFKNLILTARYKYTGDHYRDSGDDRDKLDGFSVVDMSLSYFNLGVKGLTARAGMKNLFNEDVRVPSLPNTYVEDLPRPGSRWWAQVSKNF